MFVALLTILCLLLLLLVWGAFSRLYQLEQKVNDHTFGQFKIDCPDPSEHMKFTIGKAKAKK